MVLTARTQTIVQDIFGRTLNQTNITVVDWDGYMANPLIQLYLLPPTNAALPGYATITANLGRLYFSGDSTVSSNGPSLFVNFNSATNPASIGLSIFPAHQDADPPGTLAIVFTDANNARTTNSVPIVAIDQDTHHANDFVVTANFDRDVTGFFNNVTARAIAAKAANDWAYYFTNMNLDAVAIGAESTYIWSNNYNGGYFFSNTNSYTGYQLYAYGTTNSTLTSGGEANFGGDPQTGGGQPLTLHCSGGFEANIMGNYNTLFWLLSTNDGDWLASANFADETNDFFSIAHHEIGHALIFNEGHPGFATALVNGAFTSYAVTNYYGGPAPIDSSNDHLTGVIDPESGQGAFGYEFYGNIPRYRWTMTKIDLLCAQEVGYVLRSNSAFAAFSFPSNALPSATQGISYSNTFSATGGIPIYDWDITAGALPAGLTLDSFTGVLSGSPAVAGVFNFTARVRDYHAGSAGLTHNFNLSVAAAPFLSIALSGSQVNVTLHGSAGQKQVLLVSTNLTAWTPVYSNTLSGPSALYMDTNIFQSASRYYRSQWQ